MYIAYRIEKKVNVNSRILYGRVKLVSIFRVQRFILNWKYSQFLISCYMSIVINLVIFIHT